MKLLKMELNHGADYLDYYKMVQARGKLASVRAGNFIQPIPPFGYRKVRYGKVTTLEPIEDEARIVRIIFRSMPKGKQYVGLQTN